MNYCRCCVHFFICCYLLHLPRLLLHSPLPLLALRSASPPSHGTAAQRQKSPPREYADLGREFENTSPPREYENTSPPREYAHVSAARKRRLVAGARLDAALDGAGVTKPPWSSVSFITKPRIFHHARRGRALTQPWTAPASMASRRQAASAPPRHSSAAHAHMRCAHSGQGSGNIVRFAHMRCAKERPEVRETESTVAVPPLVRDGGQRLVHVLLHFACITRNPGHTRGLKPTSPPLSG